MTDVDSADNARAIDLSCAPKVLARAKCKAAKLELGEKVLFENKVRNRVTPKRESESEFEFYDSHAGAAYISLRSMINSWISEIPAQHQDELISRFRRGSSAQFKTAMSELLIHAALVRSKWTIEIHPDLPGSSRHPDFLVRSANGKDKAYIEVTSFHPSDDKIATSNREAKIYDAINNLQLPAGYVLDFDVQTKGTSTPSLRTMCREVGEWVRSITSGKTDGPVQRIFEFGDWKIALELLGPFPTMGVAARAIGMASAEASWVAGETEIRNAIQIKGNRYGDLGVPYLIVVTDCKGELAGGEHNDEALIEAVFGTEQFIVSVGSDGKLTTRSARARDGYWGYPNHPRHQNLSAVALIPHPSLWSLRSPMWQPVIIYNPWADHPISRDILPLRHYELTERDTFRRVEARSLADILELPDKWPPAEDS